MNEVTSKLTIMSSGPISMSCNILTNSMKFIMCIHRQTVVKFCKVLMSPILWKERRSRSDLEGLGKSMNEDSAGRANTNEPIEVTVQCARCSRST